MPAVIPTHPLYPHFPSAALHGSATHRFAGGGEIQAGRKPATPVRSCHLGDVGAWQGHRPYRTSIISFRLYSTNVRRRSGSAVEPDIRSFSPQPIFSVCFFAPTHGDMPTICRVQFRILFKHDDPAYDQRFAGLNPGGMSSRAGAHTLRAR
jgi:hypothetical protein